MWRVLQPAQFLAISFPPVSVGGCLLHLAESVSGRLRHLVSVGGCLVFRVSMVGPFFLVRMAVHFHLVSVGGRFSHLVSVGGRFVLQSAKLVSGHGSGLADGEQQEQQQRTHFISEKSELLEERKMA